MELQDKEVVAKAIHLLSDSLSDFSDRKRMDYVPDCVNYLRLLIGDRKVETFVILYLDARYRLIETEEIATGTVDETSCHPRAVALKALNNCARSIIMSHNHPSGDCKPSDNDVKATRSMAKALECLDIDVLDHIVIGRAPGFPAYSIARKHLL